jgi:CelD/BcsL family acetyltransferase involved in cellulose biosynthesis
MTAVWTIHRLQNSLGEHAAMWDSLNQRLFNSHPMLDSRFVDGLLRQFGKGTERLCVLHEGDTAQIMCLLRPKFLGVWETFLPSQAQIGPTLVEQPELLRTLLPRLPGYATCLEMLCNDPCFGDLSAQMTSFEDRIHHARTMSIELQGGFDGFWSARPRSLQQNLRRYERLLTRDGITYEFRSISEVDSIATAVHRYANLEMKGWKGAKGSAVTVDSAQGIFYFELLSKYALTNEAMVFELWFGERLVASRLAIGTVSSVVMLKTTYDEEFGRYSPGRLLLREAIRSIFVAFPGKTLEFYTDANTDQLAWSTLNRSISHIVLYRDTFTKSVLSIARTIVAILKSTNISEVGADGVLSVAEYRHIDELPIAALQIVERAQSDNWEFGPAWYRNLANTVFPSDEGVRFYVLSKDDLPQVVLPLRTTRSFWSERVNSLSNYYTSLYSPSMKEQVKVGELAYLIKAVRRTQKSIGEVRFTPMDPYSPAYSLWLRAFTASGMVPFQFFSFGNWYAPVTSDWTAYLKQRSGALRSTIRRMTKKFAEYGGTLEIVSGSAGLEKGLAAFNTVYSKSWKQAEPFSEFVPGLIRVCAKHGWLRLGLAWINGVPVAAQIWVVANGKASIYKLAFDEDYRSFAPGTLLTAMLLQHTMEIDRVSEVDYLIGDDVYKQSWMSHRRERWGIVAYNPKSFRGLIGLGYETIGRSTKFLITSMARNQINLNDAESSTQQSKSYMHQEIRWQILPISEFPSVAGKWQDLCDRSLHSPLLSSAFVEVALAHFGQGNELICFGETKYGVIAAAILQSKNRLVWETFKPSQMPMGAWLMLPQLDFSSLLQSCLEALPFSTLMLGVLEVDSLFFRQPTGPRILSLDSLVTGEIVLPDSLSKYLGTLEQKPLSGLMRRRRKAEKEIGTLSLTTQLSSASAEVFVNQFAEMESRGWKGDVNTALVPGDTQSKFYIDLMHRFGMSGQARMFTLKMGERNVAAQIAIVANDVLYLLKTTYDPSLRNLGPGILLHYFITEYCYEQSISFKRIELYGPLNESQKIWISGTRKIYHLNAYRSGLLASVHRRIINYRVKRQQFVPSTATETLSVD